MAIPHDLSNRNILVTGAGPIGLMADGFAPLETQPLGHIDFADGAIAQQLHRLDFVLRGPALHPHLHHAIVFASGLHHLAAFPEFVAGGLLHVHVFARLAGPDSRERVPVITRGDRDGVDILVFEKLPDVLIGLLGFISGGLFGECDGPLDLRLVDIADGRHARLGQLRVAGDVVAPTAAHADYGDVDAVVRSTRGHA